LLAGEVEETDKEVLVRMEVPGMGREDCTITTEGNTLCITGNKHSERETVGSTYHMRERAYGSFERVIPLPRYVDVDKAQAVCKNGVLTVRMPKIAGMAPKPIHIN
jgi:HSP20 family protein